MVTEKMINDEEIKILLERIHEGNDALHEAIIKKLRTGVSIRRDVLEYPSKNAAAIDCGDQYLFSLSSLMEDPEVSPEWYEFLNRYHKDINKIGVSDLMIVISGAIQENISFEKFETLFDEDATDVLAIFSRLHGNGSDEEKIIDAVDNTDKEKEEVSEYKQEQLNESSSDDAKRESPVHVFDNLIQVITAGREREESIQSIQNKFNDYVNGLQGYVRELSVFMNDIVREWENDKIEIERLKALYEIERRLLSGQQEKISTLQNEIDILHTKLRAAEKSEIRRQEIDKKLSELQTLTKQEDGLIAMSFPESV